MGYPKNVVITTYRPTLGCDPELFFSKGGKIVGSEKVLPEDGLTNTPRWAGELTHKGVVLDGVQV